MIADTGNGHLQLVVANAESSERSVLLGEGARWFTAGRYLSAGLRHARVAVADLTATATPTSSWLTSCPRPSTPTPFSPR